MNWIFDNHIVYGDEELSVDESGWGNFHSPPYFYSEWIFSLYATHSYQVPQAKFVSIRLNLEPTQR
jgi:hypothetical protein